MTDLMRKRSLRYLGLPLALTFLFLMVSIVPGAEGDCERADDILDDEFYSLPIDENLPTIVTELEYLSNFLEKNLPLFDYNEIEDIVEFSEKVGDFSACLEIHRECLHKVGNLLVQNHEGIIADKDKYSDEIAEAISHITAIRELKSGDTPLESILTLEDKGEIKGGLVDELVKRLKEDGVEADVIDKMTKKFEGDFDAIYGTEEGDLALLETMSMAYEIETLLTAETTVDVEDFDAVLGVEEETPPLEKQTPKKTTIEEGEMDGEVFPLGVTDGVEAGGREDTGGMGLFLYYLKETDTYLIGGLAFLFMLILLLFFKVGRLKGQLLDARVKFNTINEALDDIQGSLFDALSHAEKGKEKYIKMMDELMSKRVGPLERGLIELQDRITLKENVSRGRRGKDKSTDDIEGDLVRRYKDISEKLSELKTGIDDALSKTGEDRERKKKDV